MKYRTDIDGLRAIAALAVTLFHAEVFGMTAGYAGVDIFFVISGFLITQKIMEARLSEEGFSFKEFYTRRLRRLFPAMFSTAFFTLLAGLFFFPPTQLVELAQSAIAAVLSFANIFFWLKAGYWDTSALTKPLLHTWSLGVEEQFYLIWPIIIVLAASFRRAGVLILLIVMTVISTLVTGLMTKSIPDAAFYLTPFRAFEFGIGGLCIFLTRTDWNSVLGLVVRNGLLLAGLVVTLASVSIMPENIDFPGFWALLPCLGTAMIIIAGGPPGLSLLLTNPLFRYFGLISYSLYLVHWPIFVFLRHELGELTFQTAFIGLGLTLVAAALQYHFVESPMRKPWGKIKSSLGSNGAFTRSVVGVGVGAAIMGGFVFAVVSQGGFASRYSGSIQSIASLTKQQISIPRGRNTAQLCGARVEGETCGEIVEGKTNVLIIGDSHGPDGLNIMKRAFPDANFLMNHVGGCPLYVDMTGLFASDAREARCTAVNEKRFNEIQSLKGKIDYVVVSNQITSARIKFNFPMIDWLKDQKFKFIVLGAGPTFRSDLVPMIVEYGSFDGLEEHVAAQTRRDVFFREDRLETYVKKRGGVYVRKYPYFCPTRKTCTIIMKDGMPMTFDGHHLSLSAAEEFGDYIAQTYPNLLN